MMAGKKQKTNKEREALVHVKFGPGELVKSKKEMLNSEASMVKMLKAVKNYKELRLKEIRLKKDFLKALKSAKANLRSTEKDLPKVPDSLKSEIKKIREEAGAQKEVKKDEPKKQNKKEKSRQKTDLESQLEEIMGKLRKLEQKGS